VLTGKTDATGNFTLPLTTSGTYTVAYLKDGTVVKVIEIKALPRASPGGEEKPTATGLDALGSATVGMVALLAIVVAGVIIVLMGKGKEKPKISSKSRA
jgi:hypothetical protein